MGRVIRARRVTRRERVVGVERRTAGALRKCPGGLSYCVDCLTALPALRQALP